MALCSYRGRKEKKKKKRLHIPNSRSDTEGQKYILIFIFPIPDTWNQSGPSHSDVAKLNELPRQWERVHAAKFNLITEVVYLPCEYVGFSGDGRLHTIWSPRRTMSLALKGYNLRSLLLSLLITDIVQCCVCDGCGWSNRSVPRIFIVEGRDSRI